MAGETFAFNLLNEDLTQLADSNTSQKVYWLNSQYENISSRLRENPLQFPAFGLGTSDIPANPNDLKGKLVIGNIIQLNELLDLKPQLKEALSNGFGEGSVDLISGGPPCQSFSLAGLRKKECDKNTLPWEFANFVGHIRPKIALLENVTGILRAFKQNGQSYYAWFEVAKAFASKQYVPLCLHINARFAGVPQNRPRFIMIAIREDVYGDLKNTFNEAEKSLFVHGEEFLQNTKEGKDIAYGTLPYFDAQKDSDIQLYKKSFLHHLVGMKEVSVHEAIGDIKFNSHNKQSEFIKYLNETFTSILKNRDKLPNHEERNNTPKVKRRFRIYQITQQCGKDISKEVSLFLKEKQRYISELAWHELKNYKFLLESGEYTKFDTKNDLCQYLAAHATKKQTQKALSASDPAPAALSIPDDICHYDEGELRNLTVREMARIQSFPDDFEFRSKVTTGGQMRRFEVPQYTQVGNAVPPLLGLALGKSVKELLDRL